MSRFSSLLPLFLAACGGSNLDLVPAYDATPRSEALLWQGFSQEWGYNHRVNRLGDYVGPLDCAGACTAELVHAAASGAGSDVADFRSRATSVAARDVSFVQGASLLAFDAVGAEGTSVTRVSTNLLLPEGELEGRERYVAVLGGFDLAADDDADKLAALDIALGSVETDAGVLAFDVTATLRLDCDSVECDLGRELDQDLRYTLMVSWVLVAADGGLAVTDANLSRSHTWDDSSPGDEIEADAARHRIVGEPGWTDAAVAIRSLAVTLDRDHHMAGWSTAIDPVAYDPATGAYDLDAELQFKQWNRGTWDNWPLSYTAPGSARLELGVSLLQFGNAQVTVHDVVGEVVWEADNGPADAAAVVREPVRFAVPEGLQGAEGPGPTSTAHTGSAP